MSARVDIQCASSSKDIPADADIEDWIRHTLSHVNRADAEIAVRIVDETEIADLNRTYRQNDVPTDVLAFPHQLPRGLDFDLLGDVVVCAGVINRYAIEYKVPQQSHWARIIAHGILHLCGYDHIHPNDEVRMRTAEAEILHKIGLSHPELAELVS